MNRRQQGGTWGGKVSCSIMSDDYQQLAHAIIEGVTIGFLMLCSFVFPL